MVYFLRLSLLFLVLFIKEEVYGQYEGVLYGDIVLKDRSILTGAIRWSGAQMLYSDVLLVAKSEPYALKYLNRNQIHALTTQNEGIDWEFMNLWKDKTPDTRGEPLCRFGDIYSIHVTGPGKAQIFLKNGSKVRVATDRTESRHLGKDIAVFNPQYKKIPWEKISRVNFKNYPQDFDPFRAELLYGRIVTKQGEFTGFIQWDKTKFLTSQRLEGKLNDSDKTDTEYSFSTIAGIEKRDRGALVKFRSDSKVFLKNNRDVNATNHGIVVMHPDWGRVVVEWEDFVSARFTKAPDNLGYSSYQKPGRIYAIVKTTDGGVFKGNSIFDLDEQWNVELLEGSSGNTHYQIPFKFIRSLKVNGEQESKVTLIDNRVLTLSNHNDVTGNNWGIVVLLVNSGHKYIPWNKVREISFR
ncbi:hypothetical protein [Desertivirga brevis]|uniref:hypothetical protein n=1 Tax=Desertivirga brevis TaxID=2810310 RepID=UPI001A9740A4|nr:hypothetical protein [Pedobacter sp. SYSU D00873]